MLTEWWSDLRYRLRAVVHRADADRELDDELRFHLECEADKYQALGMPRDEAFRLSRHAFGGRPRGGGEPRRPRHYPRPDARP